MSIIDNLRNAWGRWWGDEQRARVEAYGPVASDPPDGIWRSASSAPGVDVTPATALTNMAVYACVRVIAESLASLPLKLLRTNGRNKEPATNHPLYGVLHEISNREMTSFELRETLTGHLLLWGNCYAEIEMNGSADVLGLWPLRPDRMKVERVNGKLVYDYSLPARQTARLPAYRILHIRGLSSNGVVGLSPVGLARNAIGLALATEEFGGRFFANGAAINTYLEHPGKLGDDAYKRLKREVEERHTGLSNAHRISILEEGMKWNSVGMPMDDAQFLETRKFQLTDIARMFRVPPHMIQDLEHATFSNIEHQGIDFVTHTLRPWLVRWEQRILFDLIGPMERKALEAKFNVAGLLRGDTLARFQAYSIGRQWGWLSINQVLEMEDMNPIPDGDDHLQPLNMSVVGEEPPEPEPTPTQAPPATPANEPTQEDEKEAEDERAIELWIADVAQRIELRCGRERDAQKHAQWVSDVMRPVLQAVMRQDQPVDAPIKELCMFWFAGPHVDATGLAKAIRAYGRLM